MFKPFDVVLDVSNKSMNDMFEVSTNDLNTIRLDIKVKEGLKAFDLTGKIVRLAIQKPDKNVVFQTGGVTNGPEGLCEIILSRQANVVDGRHEAELMIFEGEEAVAVTTKFFYNVKKAILNDGAVKSTSDFPAINQAIEAGEALKDIDVPVFIEAANNAVAEATNAGVQAGYAKDQGDYAKQEADNAVVRLNELNGVDAVQFKNRQDGFDAELADTAKEMRLSNYGLTVNDTDGTNFSKLCSLLNTGKKIIVDNLYTIKVNTPYTLTKDFIVYGENPSCGFVFDNPNNTYVFIPAGNMNIKMYQVKISGVTNVLFYNLALANFIKEIDVTYCDFSNQISFMRFSIPSGDFDLKHGCGDILFKYNKLENLTIEAIDGGAVSGFITVNNHPINTLTFDDNNVKNFKHNIIYAATTNTHQNTALLALNRKTINANRNIVINDDGLYDDDAVGMYHSFIVAECRTLNYRDNYVEGLKSSTGKAVYDVYASCMNYFCENNTWKNNISFNLYSGALNNCLMKFKGNPDETKPASRVIKGNTYTIDSDFASRHGKEDKWLHVFLTNITSSNISVDITNNTVEVPYLNFGSSAMSPKIHKFSNNTIKAKRVMGAMCRLSTVTGWNNPSEASVEICRNTIIAEEENNTVFDFATATSSYFTLIYHSYSSDALVPKVKNIDISNNYIKGDMRSLNANSGLFEYIQSKSLIFSNNAMFNVAKAVYTNSITRLFYNSQINSLVSMGNVFENFNFDGGFYYAADVGQEFFEKVIMDQYFRVKSYNPSMSVSTIPFVNNVATKKLTFDAKYKIIRPDLTEHEAKFKCILENGKFTYINSTTNATTVVNLTGGVTTTTDFTESSMLRLYLRDNAAFSYSRKIGVGIVTGADLSNCEIYMTLRINTQ